MLSPRLLRICLPRLRSSFSAFLRSSRSFSGVVENMGESLPALARVEWLGRRPVELVREALPFLFVRPVGSHLRLSALFEDVSEALLLLGRWLVPGLLRLRLPDARAVLAEPVAKLLDGELCADLAERHGVEVGAVPVLVGEDSLAGGGQHFGRFVPSGPGVKTGDRKAAFAGVTFEGLVRLDVPFRRCQVALGSLAGDGLVVVVRKKLVDHAACAVGQVRMIGERADAMDQRVVPVHQQQRKIGFLGACDEIVPVPLQLPVERPPVGRGLGFRAGHSCFRSPGRQGLFGSGLGSRCGNPGRYGLDDLRFFVRCVLARPVGGPGRHGPQILAGARVLSAELLDFALADTGAFGHQALEHLRTTAEGRGLLHQRAVPVEGLAVAPVSARPSRPPHVRVGAARPTPP